MTTMSSPATGKWCSIDRERNGGEDRGERAMKVLLVEDEQKIADFVCAGLAERGFTTTHCTDGDEGLALALRPGFDIVVLDIMLPGRDGLAILAELRGAGVATPVLLLTARNELGDRIRGLDLGADDYLAKPFFVEELVARMHALLRRACGERQNMLQVGDLQLDPITRRASCRGGSIARCSRRRRTPAGSPCT